MGDLNWSEVVAAAVVPVVVVSACGLLCLALYNRLAAVVNRLRGFERERIDTLVALARHPADGPPEVRLRHQKVLANLDEQLLAVTRRARLLQRALLCLLSAVCALLVCSLLLAGGKLATALRPAAFAAFAAGIAAMLLGVGHAMAELWGALEPLRHEGLVVDELADELSGEGGAG
ncbi:MAG: DUF2721 domain-containing protein [Fimbriimonadaceae bacterium]|nr:DUF2721 domain-containing protein [Fimbriimonadaceae bacterium]